MALQHDVSKFIRVAKTVARDMEAPREDVVVQYAAYTDPEESLCVSGTLITIGEDVLRPKDVAWFARMTSSTLKGPAMKPLSRAL